MAAGLFLGGVFLTSMFLFVSKAPESARSTQMPALSAFSKGIVAMESGKSNQAVEWFKFALTENPDSVESSLFLAEALLQQNKPHESSEYLQRLLKKPNLDPYNRMSVTDLLGRVKHQQGFYIDALKYAREASQSGVLAQCSADLIAERIDGLANKLGVSLASMETEPSDHSSKTANGGQLRQIPNPVRAT